MVGFKRHFRLRCETGAARYAWAAYGVTPSLTHGAARLVSVGRDAAREVQEVGRGPSGAPRSEAEFPLGGGPPGCQWAGSWLSLG